MKSNGKNKLILNFKGYSFMLKRLWFYCEKNKNRVYLKYILKISLISSWSNPRECKNSVRLAWVWNVIWVNNSPLTTEERQLFTNQHISRNIGIKRSQILLNIIRLCHQGIRIRLHRSHNILKHISGVITHIIQRMTIRKCNILHICCLSIQVIR